MQFRHELKHEISLGDMMAVRARMRAICETDPHAVDGKYFIRSLYFDNPEDRALREKLDGVIPSTTSGQSADSSTLIDASHITVSDMGTMSMGNRSARGGR